jgi:hypothetical protein
MINYVVLNMQFWRLLGFADMASQNRLVKVLSTLVASMTVGAIVLMALGNNPPSAGPFSLSAYRRLDVVEQAVGLQTPQQAERWDRIEVFYSGTKAGNIEQLASLDGLATAEELNCHFCLCNGLGGENGSIQPTERWRRQWSCIPTHKWYGTGQTIRICVIADGVTTGATDLERKRVMALIDTLCRKFNILATAVYLPRNW